MRKKEVKESPSAMLMEAIAILEKEKDISRDDLFNAVEEALKTAYRNHFSKATTVRRNEKSTGGYDNVRIDMDRQTGEYHIYSLKKVVEQVNDEVLEISLADARMIDENAALDDVLEIEVMSKEFSRVSAMTAKNSVSQIIHDKEREAVADYFRSREGTIVTGICRREVKNGIRLDLGKVECTLLSNEMVGRERLRMGDRVKVYVVSVNEGGSYNNQKKKNGLSVIVSRTHPNLVAELFASEVAEIQDGTVEIKEIAREAGSRTKMAVWSNNPDVDPVGACVGLNGSRVNAVVDELRGEKIDIVAWDENPAIFIENALSPAKVTSVIAKQDENSAMVTVPDSQLSLAIGKEGQNARLAAKLTRFKIDIKSETQAAVTPGFRLEDYYDEDGNFIENDSFDAEEFEEPVSESETEEGYADGVETDGEVYEEAVEEESASEDLGDTAAESADEVDGDEA